MEVKRLVEERVADVIGVACIVDRRSPEYNLLDLPLYSALKMSINTYAPDDCPLCKLGKPLENPGSRFI